MTENEKSDMDIATLAVHGVRGLDPQTGALIAPIVQASTFAYLDAETGRAILAEEIPGYIYTRMTNPTIESFENNLAALEKAEGALAFASGMAAITATILAFCRPGENVVAPFIIYGGTNGALRNSLAQMGIVVNWAATPDAADFAKAVDKNTRLIIAETPANPNLAITDIGRVAQVAKEHGIPLAVDSTFATPILQQPITLGADLVMHSCTKYICGHGDTLGGVVAGKQEHLALIKKVRTDLGGVQSPLNAWLLDRGLRTLAVRMERHCLNAALVADFLYRHPKLEKVYYPGLPSNPYHQLADRQMADFGGMVSFELPGGFAAASRFLNSLKVCIQAVSLGDVATLACHPASTTHRSYSPEELTRAGLSPDLIRISVGLEAVVDILNDIEQALDKV